MIPCGDPAMTEEQVFLAALDLSDTAARAAYLNETCGEDAVFRRQVEALLAAHFRSGEFLDVPAAEQVKAGSREENTVTISAAAVSAEKDHEDDSDDRKFLTPSSRPDSLGRLGHYEMLQVLGRGGFGIVFRAFDDVLQRVVAVKVMAPQIATLSPAQTVPARSPVVRAGAARERGADLRGRRTAAPLPDDGVRPWRDASAEARPDRPARGAGSVANWPADR